VAFGGIATRETLVVGPGLLAGRHCQSGAKRVYAQRFVETYSALLSCGINSARPPMRKARQGYVAGVTGSLVACSGSGRPPGLKKCVASAAADAKLTASQPVRAHVPILGGYRKSLTIRVRAKCFPITERISGIGRLLNPCLL
jgi:hypothetical protein